MDERLILGAVIAGFAFVLIAGARLGAGAPAAFGGLFPTQGRNDWPIGVQESDVPRFRLPVGTTERPAVFETVDGVHALRRQRLTPQVHTYHLEA
jgi:hypothetical protein